MIDIELKIAIMKTFIVLVNVTSCYWLHKSMKLYNKLISMVSKNYSIYDIKLAIKACAHNNLVNAGSAVILSTMGLVLAFTIL